MPHDGAVLGAPKEAQRHCGPPRRPFIALDPAVGRGDFLESKNLIRADGKCVIKLDQLDEAMAEQTEAETAGREVPPERGRMLAEYVLRILRSYEQATTGFNVKSAFAQVGIHFNMVDRANTYKRVAYTDPETARAVVARMGVIPLPAELRVEPAAPWLLKIQELILNNQSPMVSALRRELAEIREELAPRPPQETSAKKHSHTEKLQEFPAGPAELAGLPPPTRKPQPPEPLPAPSPLHSAEQVYITHTHTQVKALLSCWGVAPLIHGVPFYFENSTFLAY